MQQSIDTTALPHVAAARVALLCSKWYGDIVAAMRAKCTALLCDRGACVEAPLLPQLQDL